MTSGLSGVLEGLIGSGTTVYVVRCEDPHGSSGAVSNSSKQSFDGGIKCLPGCGSLNRAVSLSLESECAGVCVSIASGLRHGVSVLSEDKSEELLLLRRYLNFSSSGSNALNGTFSQPTICFQRAKPRRAAKVF